MAEIKLPVRGDDSGVLVVGADNFCVAHCFRGSRDEVVTALNGYPKAVEALRQIMDDLDPDVSDQYHVAHETLDQLGALDV